MNTRPSTVCAATRRAIAGSLLVAAILLLIACSAAMTEPPAVMALTPIAATAPRPDGLTAEEAATLGSLAKVDDYPLYMMRYYGAYHASRTSDSATSKSLLKKPGFSGLQRYWLDATREKLLPNRNPVSQDSRVPADSGWACALFAALGDPQNRLYGRNFDWHFSPALLLYTAPSDGYASVSMVDLEHFGFSDRSTGRLVDPMTLSLAERRSLLGTPSMPFDGMNAAGVAVGMAAVPQADERHEPGKPTIGELAIIREILDHAGSVDEAVALVKQYNIDWEGGLPLHYLVADRSGRAALVEFHGGEIAVIPEAGSWHAATNFTRSAVQGSAAGQCPRYDTLVRRLTAAGGALSSKDALGLLHAVAQSETKTQWSVVYNMSTGRVDIVMGRRYGRVHTFRIDSTAP
jgi:hypothetical protein